MIRVWAHVFRSLSLAIFLLLSFNVLFAQTRLNQFALYLPNENPAASAQYESFNFGASGTLQWVGLDGAPRNYAFCFNNSVKENSYLGLRLNQFNVGLSGQTQLEVPFSQKFKLSEKLNLSLGLSPGFYFAGSRLSEAELVDQGDVEFSANQPLFAMPVARFGGLLFTEQFFLGFTIPNLIYNKVFFDETFSKASLIQADQWRYNFVVGRDFIINKNFSFQLANQTLLSTNANWVTNGSLALKFVDKITIGATYSNQADFSGFLQAVTGPNLIFGYAYQTNVGNVLFNLPTHEVMLVFKGRNIF